MLSQIKLVEKTDTSDKYENIFGILRQVLQNTEKILLSDNEF